MRKEKSREVPGHEAPVHEAPIHKAPSGDPVPVPSGDPQGGIDDCHVPSVIAVNCPIQNYAISSDSNL